MVYLPADNLVDLYEKIGEAKVTIPSDQLGLALSELLRQLLAPDAGDRIGREEAFKHPWMRLELSAEEGGPTVADVQRRPTILEYDFSKLEELEPEPEPEPELDPELEPEPEPEQQAPPLLDTVVAGGQLSVPEPTELAPKMLGSPASGSSGGRGGGLTGPTAAAATAAGGRAEAPEVAGAQVGTPPAIVWDLGSPTHEHQLELTPPHQIGPSSPTSAISNTLRGGGGGQIAIGVDAAEAFFSKLGGADEECADNSSR